MSDRSFIAEKLAAGFQPPYRGQLWDNCQRFKLEGKAYEAMPREQNGHFMIESARHLAGPARALLDPAVRMVFVVGATQVMKSVLGDIWVPYVIEHCPRNMLVLFEDKDKGDLYARTRLMYTIRHHPELKKLIVEVQEENRHLITGTKLKMPGMDLVIGGLNEGNVSSLSWPIIWVSEAWLHPHDGLLRKAIKRADRFPLDCKIFIESQAGIWEDDFHTETKVAHEVPLTCECPFCGGRQSWETANEMGNVRAEDFVARPITKVDSAFIVRLSDVKDRIETVPPNLVIWNEPKPNSYSGMKFDLGHKYLREGGQWDIANAARDAMWECHHCGCLIRDTRANRQALMDSYQQDYRKEVKDTDGNGTGEFFSPSDVCFRLPREAARDNTFEKSTLNYLTAKYKRDYAGDPVAMRDWYMSERAKFYRKDLDVITTAMARVAYDVKAPFPNELCRSLFIDVQENLSHFWYSVHVIGSDGSSRQLECGSSLSFADLVKIQQRWEVPNQCVFVDCGHMYKDVINECAQHRLFAKVIFGKRHTHTWICWNAMRGSGLESFGNAAEETNHPVRFPPGREGVPTPDGMMRVEVYHFSNLVISDMARNYRDGINCPKAEFLPDDMKMPEDLRWSRQLTAEHRSTVISERTGKVEERWVRLRKDNHGWDLLKMLCAQMVILRVAQMPGLPTATQTPAVTATAAS